MIDHGFGPEYDSKSRVLILGSFPSVKSREEQFYYAHPGNRFWRILALIHGESVPETVKEKKDFLRRNRIALYDAIEACEVEGSMDSDIGSPVPADLSGILERASIERICANGKKAYDVATKMIGVPCILLPSSSAANARYSLECLVEIWRASLYPDSKETPTCL